jgi:hypothetical protein
MFEAQSPPLMDPEWETAGGPSSGRWARDLDTHSDERMELPRQPPIYSSNPSSPRPHRAISNRPPVGRRIVRAMTRFLIAVFIGVAATLAWQSYGDAARNMLAARAPTLAWLLSVSATSPIPAMSAESAQQLGSLASGLDVIRRSVEQLAAKQDQMVQNIALLRAAEEDIREKMLSASPSSVEQPAPIPQPRPQQPRVQPSVSRAPPAAVPLTR